MLLSLFYIGCFSQISQSIQNKLDRDDDGFNGEVDCDDDNPSIHPQGHEICNELDDDCDGFIDDADESVDTSTGQVFYIDQDLDGYGQDTLSVQACLNPTGYAIEKGDCDDENSYTCPSCAELCDEEDNNCNNVTDEDAQDKLIGYLDSDGDGYGAGSEIQLCEYELEEGATISSENSDCDDINASIFPSQDEICNEIDDDCDNLIDDLDDSRVGGNWFYKDEDLDGYGDIELVIQMCLLPSGYVENSEDCDDTVFSINPQQSEICNGIDDDCSELLTGFENTEDGLAFFMNSSGFGTDVSSIYQSNEELTLSDGILSLCGGESSFQLVGNNIEIHGIANGTPVIWNGGHQTSLLGGNIALNDIEIRNNSIQFENANITIENIDITDSSAPLQLYQSTLQGADIFLTNNTSVEGGAIRLQSSTLYLENAEILSNSADSGGAIYASTSSLQIVDSNIDNNEASVGGALFLEDSDCLITGQPLPYVYGFDGNLSNNGAIYIDETSLVEFQNIDFGVSEMNSIFDIFTESQREYQAGEDSSFVCTFGSCGTSLVYDVGQISIDELHQNNSFRGNVYQIVGQPTLDKFEFRMTYSTCDFDFYVYARATESDPWSLLWNEQSTQNGITDWATSPSIGLSLQNESQVLLGASWICDGSPDYYTYTSDLTTEYGIGSWAGIRAFAGGIEEESPFVLSNLQTEMSSYLYEQRIHVTNLAQ